MKLPVRARAALRGLVAAAVILSVALNLAFLIYQHVRTDQRQALWAGLAGREHRGGPTIILGDSIIAGVTTPEGRAINLAVPGATVDWIAANQIDLIATLRPARIIVMAGVNDLRAGTNPENVVVRFLNLADALKSAAPRSQITVLAILPPARASQLAGSASVAKVSQTNRLLVEEAAEHALSVVDHSTLFAGEDGLYDRFSYDGLHLNAAGLALLEDVLFHGLVGGAEGS